MRKWSTKKGKSSLNQHRSRIKWLLKMGFPQREIAEVVGTTRGNLARWLKVNKLRISDHSHPVVKCALIECEETFPFKKGKICCCRQHIKRFNGRKNNPASFIECGLPECHKTILNTKRKFCSKQHGDLHSKRHQTGFYERLKSKSPCCEVCGEWRVLDEHHIEFFKGKSNKQSKTVWLCPTHHLAMHRRLAVYDENGFSWKDKEIVTGLSK